MTPASMHTAVLAVLAVLGGCSLGADAHKGASPINSGAAGSMGTPAEAGPMPGPAHEGQPAEDGENREGSNVADHGALDELGNAACAGGRCNIAVQHPSGPVLAGQVECSALLEWATPGWVEVETGSSNGAKLASDSHGNTYFAGSLTGDITFGPFSVQAKGRAEGFVMKLGSCTSMSSPPISRSTVQRSRPAVRMTCS